MHSTASLRQSDAVRLLCAMLPSFKKSQQSWQLTCKVGSVGQRRQAVALK